MPFKAKQHVGLFSLLAAAAVLAGCAHSPQFSGQSVTDPLLRKDVYATVQNLFSAMTQCRSISEVNSRVESIDQSPAGAVQKATETWQVSGCGNTKSYKVVMRADAKGETDFSVSPQS